MTPELAQRVLGYAYEDWRNDVSERDLSRDSRLADMFRTTGFANSVAINPKTGLPFDWCGMSVAEWLVLAGMHPGHAKSFLETRNIESFATYGDQKNVNARRLAIEVLLDGVWTSIRDWHAREGQPRVWIPEVTLRAGPASDLDIRPGDVVLLDYQGVYDTKPDEASDQADHITMAAEFRNGVLEVMNGNASGLDTDGGRVTDSVARTIHDLNDAKARKRLYGVARLSNLDFRPEPVR